MCIRLINVDISNVWGQIALPDLLAMESEVAAAHEMLKEGTGAGSDYRQWLDLPVREATEETERIQKAAERIRQDSEVCLVLGAGGNCLGSRAAIELLQGCNHNIGKGRGNPQIFFCRKKLFYNR